MICIFGHDVAWDMGCNDCTPNNDCLHEGGIGKCPNFNWISTTIKKIYLDNILVNNKTSEYKGASEFWIKRLEKYIGPHENDLGINFLCGKMSVKFFVKEVHRYNPIGFPYTIDGVEFKSYYDIKIGNRIETEKVI